MPYTQEGLEAGEKVIHITDTERRVEQLARLTAAGMDLAAGAGDQLTVRPWDAGIGDRAVDANSMLQLLEDTLASGYAGGYRHVRLVGHMAWSLQTRPGMMVR